MMQCVLLNADYSFLNMVHWKRAFCLLAKGKVEVVRETQQTIRNSSGQVFKVPAVMRLIKLIRTIYRARVAFTKRNVLVRDRFQCAYCGTRKEKLSIDHIIPKSRGGQTNFENCVAACKACNLKKGSRIIINGRLKQDRWQDDNGGNRSKISIVGNQVQFLDLKNGDGEETGGDELY